MLLMQRRYKITFQCKIRLEAPLEFIETRSDSFSTYADSPTPAVGFLPVAM